MPLLPPEYEDFWSIGERAQPKLLRRDRFLEAFAFGDSQRLADLLAALVLSGAKRATASSLWNFEHEKKTLPAPGDLSIVTSWDKEPLCVIETTDVDIVPFDQVSAEFARIEGEDDGTLESWRANHRAFFNRECNRIGKRFQDDMPVVCEQFNVLFQRL